MGMKSSVDFTSITSKVNVSFRQRMPIFKDLGMFCLQTSIYFTDEKIFAKLAKHLGVPFDILKVQF